MTTKWDELKRLAENSIDGRSFEYLAKANPANVLELIAEVERLTATVSRQHEEHRKTFSKLEQVERNRDMWQSCCKRQAEKLERLQNIVTSDHETKASFIAHVRNVLDGDGANG